MDIVKSGGGIKFIDFVFKRISKLNFFFCCELKDFKNNGYFVVNGNNIFFILDNCFVKF